jgi:hypothetical protein
MIHCPKCGEDWSEVAAIRAATKERDATIATLRAALDGLIAAVVLDRMDQWYRDSLARDELARQTHDNLRAALATAYAATCSAESDQQVSATKEAGG